MWRRVRSAPIGTLVALLATTGCAAPVGVPGTVTASGVERLTDGLPVPELRWEVCPDAPVPGVQCADLSVPLDYRDRDGRRITVRVSRLPASDRSTRRGVLVSNPGGPGAPGLYNTLGVDQLAGGALHGRYDLVGFDPRGTGRSTPVVCALSDQQVLTTSLDRPPTTPELDEAGARAVAAGCAQVADTLTFITTANIARDLEMLRAALGEERLGYSGISGGVSLGTTYAALYPERVDRFLLDSLDDATTDWYPRLRASDAAIEERFTEVATRLAGLRPALGADASAVRERWLSLASRAARGEVAIGGEPMTVAALYGHLDAALRDDDAVPPLGDLIAVLDRLPGAPPVSDLHARLSPEPIAADPVALSAGLGVVCGDTRWPTDPRVYRDAVAADAAAFPVSRGTRAAIRPCAFWPSAPRDPLPSLSDRTHAGPPNVLLLQNTRDPATPLPGALRLRTALGARAVLVTTGRGGHGVLGVDPCATRAAITWLVDGILPRADTTC